MSSTAIRNVTIAKRRFELSKSEVERAMQDTLPEPIASHYVVVGSRRYPPKQVIGLVTGVDRADFTSHQARRILMGLGFAVGRRPSSAPEPLIGARLSEPGRAADDASPGARARRWRLAEELRAFKGQWVAVKSDELLVAAPTPHDVVAWLSQHGRRADSVFRVPESELAMGGMAPL